MRVSAKKNLILVGVGAVSAALLIAPFCGFMFKCGCSWLWTTADQYCNIRHAMPPHCPWCSYGNSGFLLVMIGFVSGQWLTGMFTLRATGKFWLASLVTLVAFVPVGLLMGAITSSVLHYPHFVFH